MVTTIKKKTKAKTKKKVTKKKPAKLAKSKVVKTKAKPKAKGIIERGEGGGNKKICLKS